MARKKAGERRQENYTKEDIWEWWMTMKRRRIRGTACSGFTLIRLQYFCFPVAVVRGKFILSQPARETRKKHGKNMEKAFKIHPTSPLNHLKLLDVKDSFSHCSSEIRSCQCLPIASELVTQIAIAKGRPSLVAWVSNFIYFLHFFFFSIFFSLRSQISPLEKLLRSHAVTECHRTHGTSYFSIRNQRTPGEIPQSSRYCMYLHVITSATE